MDASTALYHRIWRGSRGPHSKRWFQGSRAGIGWQVEDRLSVVDDIEVLPVRTLSEVVEMLRGQISVPAVRADIQALFQRESEFDVDYAEVRGQEHVKRALEIAAAGGHNLVMIGPPGSGKTMLAKRLPTILSI